MLNIILELIDALIIVIIFIYLFLLGKKQGFSQQKGWRYIIAGFGLVFLGDVFDFTDNFTSLNKYIIIGDTPAEAFIEKFIGHLIGYVLIFAGLLQWLPLLIRQRRTEEALAMSEKKYKELFDGARDVIFTISTEGTFISLNPAFDKITGWACTEWLGEHFAPIIHPDDLPLALDNLQHVLKGETPPIFELRARSKSGLYLVFEFIVAPQISDGKVAAIMGIARDITERKKSEDILRRERDKAQQYLDIAGVMLVAIDANQNVKLINKKGCEILGYCEEDIIGKNWFDIFIPEKCREDVKDVFVKIMKGETEAVEYYENSVVTKNGEERLIAWHNSLIRDDEGNITGTLSSGEDITEHKKSEEFIKNILETVDEGFIVVDPDYRIINANRAYCRQVGIPLEDIIGKHCHEVSHHISRRCFEAGEDCSVKRAFESGEPYTVLHTHYDDKGNPVYVETKSYPVKDASGKVVSAIEVINNITEKKRLEDQLRHAQKMEAIGTFAGGIAHDFNNILTAMIGYGNLLNMKMKEDDPAKHYVEQILASSERAANLTHSLLAFSRKQIINPRPVNLNEIVKGTGKFLLRLIGEDIELKTVTDDSDLMVMADSGQIEQVLMNLATNARDAMPDGGALTIKTEQMELDNRFMRQHNYGKAGTYALISITDTGTGMDERTIEKIFEPFFTTKEVGKGTGLGLAIAYGIIKQHNGYINVYSEPGKGTTFRIYLPLIKARLEGTKKEDLSVPIGGTETILLVEDDEAIRRFTRSMFEEFGYKVIEAIDGEDAILKFSEQGDAIDILILDLVMPRKNGREAYDRIKQMRPGVKAIFTSGYADDVIQKAGIAEEGMNFISKPVSPQKFLKKVREVLDK